MKGSATQLRFWFLLIIIVPSLLTICCREQSNDGKVDEAGNTGQKNLEAKPAVDPNQFLQRLVGRARQDELPVNVRGLARGFRRR